MSDDQLEPTQGSIGGAIIEKVLENIKNMDVPSVLNKIIESSTDDPDSADAKSKLQSILEKYNTMTAEEKESFTNQIKSVLATKMATRLQDKLGGLDEALVEQVMNKIYMMIAAGVVVVVMIGMCEKHKENFIKG